MQTQTKSKFWTSTGKNWRDVTISELKGMVQDGKEAAALLAAIEEQDNNPGQLHTD